MTSTREPPNIVWNRIEYPTRNEKKNIIADNANDNAIYRVSQQGPNVTKISSRREYSYTWNGRKNEGERWTHTISWYKCDLFSNWIYGCCSMKSIWKITISRWKRNTRETQNLNKFKSSEVAANIKQSSEKWKKKWQNYPKMSETNMRKILGW